jgi:hypothetical protein
MGKEWVEWRSPRSRGGRNLNPRGWHEWFSRLCASDSRRHLFVDATAHHCSNERSMSLDDPIRRPRKVPDFILLILACVIGLIAAAGLAGGAYDALNSATGQIFDVVMMMLCAALLLVCLRIVCDVIAPPFRRERCPYCGYDLRATPTRTGRIYGRCPECGATPPRWSEYDD